MAVPAGVIRATSSHSTGELEREFAGFRVMDEFVDDFDPLLLDMMALQIQDLSTEQLGIPAFEFPRGGSPYSGLRGFLDHGEPSSDRISLRCFYILGELPEGARSLLVASLNPFPHREVVHSGDHRCEFRRCAKRDSA